MSCDWNAAELPDGLQNGTHRGTGVAADSSTHGRMGLGTTCREETLRMKNISIVSSGEKKYAFGLRKTVFSQENTCNNNSLLLLGWD
jgi:hypothetical protein